MQPNDGSSGNLPTSKQSPPAPMSTLLLRTAVTPGTSVRSFQDVLSNDGPTRAYRSGTGQPVILITPREWPFNFPSDLTIVVIILVNCNAPKPAAIGPVTDTGARSNSDSVLSTSLKVEQSTRQSLIDLPFYSHGIDTSFGARSRAA